METKYIVGFVVLMVVAAGGFYMYGQPVAPSVPAVEEMADTRNDAAGAPVMNAKIDVGAVCEGALIYMSFPDGASADAFVQECKDGKHPEVIERYIAELNLNGAAI